MRRKSLRAILLVALIIVSGQVWSSDRDSLLMEAESLSAAGNPDSSLVIFKSALLSAESSFGPSDSTVDLVFYDSGIPRRIYYRSFAGADSLYSGFLTVAEQVYGSESVVVSDLLLRRAEIFWGLGNYNEALPLLERSLGIRQKEYGVGSVEAAEALDRLGVMYYRLGMDLEAATYCDSSLVLREKLLGRDHLQVGWSCLNLGRVIAKLGYYSDAEAFCVRGMDIIGGEFGDWSLERSDCLEALGFALYYGDKNAAAESLFVEALAIRRELLGARHPEVATLLLRMANAYRYLNRYEQAESLFTEALDIRRSVYGERHPEVAEVWYYLGMLLVANLKDIDRGLRFYTEAATVFKSTLDKTNPNLIAVETRIAGIFLEFGRYQEAIALYKELHQRMTERFGADHSQLLNILSRLALVSRRTGNFDDAEEYARRALAIARTSFGEKHPTTAVAMKDLAVIYCDEGRYVEGEELLKESVAIMEAAAGNLPPDFMGVVEGELGRVCTNLGRYSEAETHYLKAIRHHNDAFGPKNTDGPICYLNLGLVYEAMGRYGEADSVYQLSIEIGESSLGPQNPALAHALNNRANLYSFLGRYDEAQACQARAISILEGALGPEHPEVAKFRCDEGRIYAYSGEVDSSLGSYEKYIDMSQKYLENVFPYSSEEQKLRWIHKYPLSDASLYSLALKRQTGKATSLAMEMLLKSKAMVIEAVMAERQAAYCHYDDEVLSELDRLNEINEQIAGLAMAGSYYRDSVVSLYKVRDSLEVELSRYCSEFSDALAARRFEVADVVSSVPEGSVLWEYARYEPRDLDLSVKGADKIGPARYLAFTVEHNGRIGIHDLGDAALVDSLILTARDLIYRSQGQIYSVAAVTSERRLREITSRLYDILFAPLVSSGTTDIYISPDGMLNLIPFEVFPVSDSEYVIERYRLSYLSSGRDLLKYKGSTESSGEVLVLADPDFDGEGVLSTRTKPETVISDDEYGPDFRGNMDCLTEKFSPLSYSRSEASSVVGCFRSAKLSGVRQYYGDKAVEGVLKNLPFAPRVVHLATHGFFCKGQESSESLRDNPLLRSGLAFTGANRTISGDRASTEGDDGILTALEVSGLNFVGTDLAVLSACESGVGDLVDGEGIFGLRRAFQHAGVNTIVMSLWSVPDRETSQLMEGFYRRWLQGESKRDALRGSALEVLNQSRAKRGCGHPLLWGGFILAGNPN